jgi:hypothetical protein
MLWDDHCEPVLQRLFGLVCGMLDMSTEDLRHVALLVWLAHLRQHAETRSDWTAQRRHDWIEAPARSARRWLAAAGALEDA